MTKSFENSRSGPCSPCGEWFLKFRGWVPKRIPLSGTALADADFKPEFHQKGVYMRIGLDIGLVLKHQNVILTVPCSGARNLVRQIGTESYRHR